MLQIINVVVPTFQSMLGCLWPYSTAKLEARGARVKPIVRRCIHASFVLMYRQCTYVYPLSMRRQTSARPKTATSSETATPSTARRGKANTSSQTEQTIARVAIREQLLMSNQGVKPSYLAMYHTYSE